ncbi:DNA-binding response regulator [Paenibacillus ferrarius]|uniref:DNA-binding response regulator n=1 Tax=Paenibacillus ferrarius TaxID=1469647 RepID=A0A1V4HIY8_9BACL|nr:response regulator [Paenibacillus ferrarius]OPH56966.1 DNA-binding response regulator [Paenibacillus ferrarius]
MYRLLIVDDEEFIANGIRASVNWSKFGIIYVSVVNSARKAKEHYSKHPVDIMLCDIEMPQGSGLELYEWVREEHPWTECVFLTCHADFQYAKKAIQLGSFEYLLKPAPPEELERVMMELIKKISKDRKSATIVIERFWQDLLKQVTPSRPDNIKEEILKHNIPYTSKMKFLPVLISIHHWEKELNAQEALNMEYAVTNALEELVIRPVATSHIVRIKVNQLLALFPTQHTIETREEEFLQEIVKRFGLFIDLCNRHLGCHLSCYLGQPTEIHDMRGMVEDLEGFRKMQVNAVDRVVHIEEKITHETPFPMPSMKVWSELIKQGDKKKLLVESQQFLESLKQIEWLNSKSLQKFYLNFQHMVMQTLQQKGLFTEDMLSDHFAPERISSAVKSVKDLQDWVKDVLEIAMTSIEGPGSNETVVEKIKRYIAANIDQEMSRQYIADYIDLSPDYMVKLFKKETGLSISEYILKERIDLAKELLIKSETSISNVSLAVGFVNFSYFSTLFKKEVSMTPQEYRKRFSGM